MTEFKIGQIYREVLQDGETRRVSLKDAARICDACSGSGKIKDLGIRCPVCGSSGFLNSEGQGIDETVAATSNSTEGARGGEFGNDHATLSDHDRFMLHDAEVRLAASGNRAGFRFARDSEERRAAQQKIADAREEYIRYVNTAYRDLEPLNPSPDVAWNTGTGSPSKNFGKPPQPGAQCSTADGRPGHIGASGECVADSSFDAMTLDQKVAEHRRIMDAEYQKYEAQITSAHKNPR